MLIINDTDELTRAIRSDLPSASKRILLLREDLIGLATFIVVQPADIFDEVQTALAFAIDLNSPPWEWVLDHRGAFEAPVIYSDDGYGTVLIVPDEIGIDATLLEILRSHAELAGTTSSDRHEGQDSNAQ